MERHTILIICTLAAALFTGCSVKEDRAGCPCRLDIDVSLCSRRGETVSLRGWNSSRPLFGGTLQVADWPDMWETTVPKGIVHYTAYTGTSSCMPSGSTLVIPEGNQCDSLWAYCTSVICEGEDASDRVYLHKQFCTVTMEFTRDIGGRPGAVVTGHSAGMSLEGLSPVEGTFRYSPADDGQGHFIFRLPRQADSVLDVEITRDGKHYETFPLGTIISRTGYDWTAQDLDDIYVGVDLIESTVTIRLEKWEEGTVYELEI